MMARCSCSRKSENIVEISQKCCCTFSENLSKKTFRPSKNLGDFPDRLQENASYPKVFIRKLLPPDGFLTKAAPTRTFRVELALFSEETSSAEECASQSLEGRRGSVLQFFAFLTWETWLFAYRRAPQHSSALRSFTTFSRWMCIFAPPAGIHENCNDM